MIDFAVIENGIVTNIVYADIALHNNWVEIPKGFGIGIDDSYDGTIFTKKFMAAPAIIPSSITMAQARKALHASGLYTSVNSAILSGTDEVLKIEWEYETTVKRDNTGLIVMANMLGITESDLDNLFILGEKL